MLPPPIPWQPLLDGALAARARQTVRDVAEALAARTVQGSGLAGGRAGIALFFAYLAEAWDEERWADAAMAHLDRAADALSSEPLRPDLYVGFTGIAWCFSHLSGRLFEAEGDGSSGVDHAIAGFLAQRPWHHDYDLIRGLAGFGVYALERLPRPEAADALERVVDRLAETAVEDGAGIAWFTPPGAIPAPQQRLYPRGYYNCGVAHGGPGTLPVLAAAAAAGIASDRARSLFDGHVAWLLDHRFQGPGACRFPSAVAPGEGGRPSRLAWCYGDPGVAASLHAAARRLDRSDLAAEALAVAAAAAAQPFAASNVVDAGLCHGAAGLGHLFHRLFRDSGDERLAAAARRWFEACLDLRHPDRGIAGFAAWDIEGAGDEPGWQDDPGFLTGAAGVGLSLLAATSSLPPDWDRLLAISLPPA